MAKLLSRLAALKVWTNCYTAFSCKVSYLGLRTGINTTEHRLISNSSRNGMSDGLSHTYIFCSTEEILVSSRTMMSSVLLQKEQLI